MRRMRNAFTKTGLNYRPCDQDNIRLREEVIKYFNLRDGDFTEGEIPTPINAVVEPIFKASREYISRKEEKNLKKMLVFPIVTVLMLSTSAFAEEIYHCIGKYNSGAVYDHVYTVNRNLLGGELVWEGQSFKIQNHPLRLYAVAITDLGVEVLFIDNETLNAEFSSIHFGTPLLASGKCKKIK